MKPLAQLADAIAWLQARVTGDLHTDSRKVRPGDGFLAWPGLRTDGRLHVGAALQQGAAACLVEHAGAAQVLGLDAQAASAPAWAAEAATKLATYNGLKAAAGELASAYWGWPSRALDVIAVTGTNGKTSTAWWLAQALAALDWPCGVVGTLGIGCPPDVKPTGLTTPDPVLLQQQLRHFVQQGLKACAIEASSIGIAEGRLAGAHIKVAVFTNFTQDHLDYHGSMDAYWQAKRMLFAWPGMQSAVVNLDDAQGAALVQALGGSDLGVWTVSCGGAARLQARDIGYDAQGLRFVVAEGAQAECLQTRLMGQYNVSNVLGVIGAMRALGVSLADAVQACKALTPVPGRMECLTQPGQPWVVVDYAHTPDALDKALAALLPLARQRKGRLWCVFGCGGDRDPSKRPQMGAVAERLADRVVLTSDNPRTEDPAAIIADIHRGWHHPERAQVEPDRAAAIAQALAQANAADVVLLAGKGHEDYQEVAGLRRPFSDQAQALVALQQRRAMLDRGDQPGGLTP
jgi:UDP-N-acetylmuramoyl-L-alanyl-D-glutamate--2,6-diaminopimelate ligase